MVYSHAANSTTQYSQPYAMATTPITQIDKVGIGGTMTLLMTFTCKISSGSLGCSLQGMCCTTPDHLCDFDECWIGYWEEGIFDQQELNIPSVVEETCMAYYTMVFQRLLVQIEELEHFVRPSYSISVGRLDLSQYAFSSNFYFLTLPLQFPSMFPFLIYSQSLSLLLAIYSRHSRPRTARY